VNLSARSLNDKELAQYIEGCMQQHNVKPGHIVLEITESAAMRNIEHTARVLKQLRAIGVLIALDDFGIGHSSLAHLKNLPIDILKLDRSFVKDLGTDAKIEELVEVIINLAHRIGACIVAEGVESNAQLHWLRGAGCDYVQGYLIGHPEPADVVKPLEAAAD
jgi:EAL domain-containing protein (putative c-di-GMP-specific phosphodiesterase class I)